MPRKIRQSLKDFFQTGYKPTHENFVDLMDSTLNLEDDGIYPVTVDNNKRLGIGVETPRQRLDIAGAIKIQGDVTTGSGNSALAGSIAFDSAAHNLKFHDGTDWQDVGSGTGGGGTGTGWVPVSGTTPGNEKWSLGNVMVGNKPGSTAGQTEAFLSHKDLNNIFAFVQNDVGALSFQTTAAQPMSFSAAAGGTVIDLMTLIANTPTDKKLTINANVDVNGTFRTSSGSVDGSTSDIRVKENIVGFNKGLDIINNIEPKSFSFNGQANTPQGLKKIGVIAQDLQALLPEMVSSYRAKLNPDDQEETDVLQIDSSVLIYTLINAVKELSQKVELLESNLAVQI